jgi:hypothetical protein
MKQVEIKKVMMEEPSAIICDVCGEKYDLNDYVQEIKASEFLELDFVGGYFSPFGDMTRVQIDVCPDCVFKLLGKYARTENRYDIEEED